MRVGYSSTDIRVWEQFGPWQPQSPTERAALRRQRARVTVAVIAIAVPLWLALVAWALSSPVASSPDDNYHLPQIYCAAGELNCVDDGVRPLPCFAFASDRAADCIDWQNWRVPIGTGQQASWYPPAYYATMSHLLGDTVGETTVNVRLFNSTLAVLMAVGAVLLTRRSWRRAVIMSWLFTTVPLGMFIITSINPNAWALMGLAAIWGPLASLLTEDRFSRITAARFLFAVVAAFLALGSRSESPVLLVFIVIAIGVLTWPGSPRHWSRHRWLRMAMPASLLMSAAAFFALYGQSKAQKVLAAGNAGAGAPISTGFSDFQVVINSIWTLVAGLGFPGVPLHTIGWLDTPIPPEASFFIMFAYVGALAIGLSNLWPRKSLALVVYFGLSFLFITYLWSQAINYRWQPRYFLVTLFVVLGLALLPRARDYGKGPGAVPLAAFVAAIALANSSALMANVTRYVAGLEFPVIAGNAQMTTLPSRLQRTPEPSWWWSWLPLSPYQLWIAGSLAFAVATVGLYAAMLRLNRAPGQAMVWPAAALRARDLLLELWTRRRPQTTTPTVDLTDAAPATSRVDVVIAQGHEIAIDITSESNDTDEASEPGEPEPALRR